MAIEVVEGNVGDSATIPTQVAKVKDRFSLERVVVVGDRGMVTEARIREDISTVGYDWISALRHGAIRPMVEAKVITPSLFDGGSMSASTNEQEHARRAIHGGGIAEIAHPDFLGERLIACFNPITYEERTRKREILLQLTEKALQKVSEACDREKNPLEGKGEIGLKAGAVLTYKQLSKVERAFRTLKPSTCRSDRSTTTRKTG